MLSAQEEACATLTSFTKTFRHFFIVLLGEKTSSVKFASWPYKSTSYLHGTDGSTDNDHFQFRFQYCIPFQLSPFSISSDSTHSLESHSPEKVSLEL